MRGSSPGRSSSPASQRRSIVASAKILAVSLLQARGAEFGWRGSGRPGITSVTITAISLAGPGTRRSPAFARGSARHSGTAPAAAQASWRGGSLTRGPLGSTPETVDEEAGHLRSFSRTLKLSYDIALDRGLRPLYNEVFAVLVDEFDLGRFTARTCRRCGWAGSPRPRCPRRTKRRGHP